MKNWEAVREWWCCQSSFGTRAQPAHQVHPETVWLADPWGPLEFRTPQSSQRIVKQSDTEWRAYVFICKLLFIHESVYGKGLQFGEHLEVFSHWAHFLACASGLSKVPCERPEWHWSLPSRHQETAQGGRGLCPGAGTVQWWSLD